jgi:hypothetical protein
MANAAVRFAVCCALALGPALATAATIELPRTGQSSCSDPSGSSWETTPCFGLRVDGDLRRGLPWPYPRFTDNSDGTIVDNLTGLLWLKNADCQDWVWGDWSSAVAFARTLSSGECGLTDGSADGDWRLPNVLELQSLLHGEAVLQHVWLLDQGFVVVRDAYYWTSTTRASATHHAYVVNLSDSTVVTTGKQAHLPLWPVRGSSNGSAQVWRTGQSESYTAGDDGDLETGAAWPVPRFTDNADGTITDHLTDLVWSKNADCFGTRTFAQGLADAAGLESGQCGLSDGSAAGQWRLPNRNELRSLMDFSHNLPALPAGHPFVDVVAASYEDMYWTSSDYSNDRRAAMDLRPSTATLYGAWKWLTGRVWPVRGGEPGLIVASCYPHVGGAGGAVSMTVAGSGLDPAATVYLARAGQPAIPGTGVLVEQRDGLSAHFDLAGAALGVWDVVVSNPNAATDALERAFTVEPAGAPEPWVEVVGYSEVTLGRNAVITLTVGNRGNVDAPIQLEVSGAPPGSSWSLDWPLSTPVGATDILALHHFASDTQSAVYLPTIVVPPASTVAVRLRVGFPVMGTYTLAISWH